MSDYLLPFSSIAWEQSARGAWQKSYSRGNQRIRLVRFDGDFAEAHWCTNGHVGYVIKGEMTINFDGTLKKFQAGDGLWIEAGTAHQHKVLMEKGGSVELVLFEVI